MNTNKDTGLNTSGFPLKHSLMLITIGTSVLIVLFMFNLLEKWHMVVAVPAFIFAVYNTRHANNMTDYDMTHDGLGSSFGYSMTGLLFLVLCIMALLFGSQNLLNKFFS